jgi:hypothetical protein
MATLLERLGIKSNLTMATLLERLGIKSNLTMAFNPQANGQTERANQEVEKYLRFYVTR